VAEIVRLINQAYRVEEFFAIGDRISEADVLGRLSGPGDFLIIEEVGGDGPRLIGSVYVRAAGTRGYFGPVAVDPDHQRRGLGRRLVLAAEDYCRVRGCDRMDMDIVDVRAELTGFYQQLGYREAGTAPFPSPERLRTDAHLILMTKRL
jgi:GNAT superfamily N-acetyltransferase